jgi:hypothetical protein
MNVDVARDAGRFQTQKRSIQILQPNFGFHSRRDALRIVTLAALKRRVLAFEIVASLAVIKRASPAFRPANQFEIASNMFLVTGDTIRIALRSVNNPCVIAALCFEPLLNFHMA